VADVHRQRLLCLRLRNPDLYYQELPLRKRMLVAANQRLGFGEVTLSFQTLRPSLQEALEFIRGLGTIPIR
jgi:hypothetical protein